MVSLGGEPTCYDPGWHSETQIQYRNAVQQAVVFCLAIAGFVGGLLALYTWHNDRHSPSVLSLLLRFLALLDVAYFASACASALQAWDESRVDWPFRFVGGTVFMMTIYTVTLLALVLFVFSTFPAQLRRQSTQGRKVTLLVLVVIVICGVCLESFEVASVDRGSATNGRRYVFDLFNIVFCLLFPLASATILALGLVLYLKKYRGGVRHRGVRCLTSTCNASESISPTQNSKRPFHSRRATKEFKRQRSTGSRTCSLTGSGVLQSSSPVGCQRWWAVKDRFVLPERSTSVKSYSSSSSSAPSMATLALHSYTNEGHQQNSIEEVAHRHTTASPDTAVTIPDVIFSDVYNQEKMVEEEGKEEELTSLSATFTALVVCCWLASPFALVLLYLTTYHPFLSDSERWKMKLASFVGTLLSVAFRIVIFRFFCLPFNRSYKQLCFRRHSP